MKQIFLILALSIINTYFSFSQTIINGGNVSGTWAKSGSPYLVSGEITIPVDQILTIEKGVRVEFQGHYKFIVQGRLVAIGNRSDSIVFTSKDNSTRWGGLRFYNIPLTNDSSKVVYCVVENGFASSGLLPNQYSSDDTGGGIFIQNSKLLISNSDIRNNQAYLGGGIYCDNRSLILNTLIRNNYADLGGGVCINDYRETNIIGCIITDNSGKRVGGIYIGLGNSLIMNNTICYNISNDTFRGSVTVNGWSKLVNNIIYYNTPAHISSDGSNPDFISCDIEGGIQAIHTQFPSVDGFFTGVFRNIIVEPPLFVNRETRDYRLASSPCINSGNDSIWWSNYKSDINGNPRIFNDQKARIDIGACEYQGVTPNRAPYVRKTEEKYFLKSQKSNLAINFFDPDSADILTFKISSGDQHVTATILNVNDSSVLTEINPEENWTGECYVIMEINDNSNSPNSINTDSIKIYISNRFKGEINTDMIFQDTVKVIGNIHIAKSGNLLIKAGSFIEFQDAYKFQVLGKLNILGTDQNKVILNALDTSVYYSYEIRFEHGWDGIQFIGIDGKDTLFINNCLIKNTGRGLHSVSSTGDGGTISITDSKNIYFNDCSFENNYAYTSERNSGIFAKNSKNIHIKNCSFTTGVTFETYGTYIHSMYSDLNIEKCNFNDIFTYRYFNNQCIYSVNSNTTIKDSYFSDNQSVYLISSYGGNLTIENTIFHNNSGSCIQNFTSGALIRNNIFTGNKSIPITARATLYVVGNLIAYNGKKAVTGNLYGGAINLEGASGLIANNTLVDNFPDNYNNVIYIIGSPTVTNNIVWGKDNLKIGWFNGVDHEVPDPIIKNNLIKGGYYDKTYVNYDFDPSFRLNDSLDFQLLNTSNCINMGLHDTTGLFLTKYDLSGNQRVDPYHQIVDLGAYEYQGADVINYPPESFLIDYPLNNRTTTYKAGKLEISSTPATDPDNAVLMKSYHITGINLDTLIFSGNTDKIYLDSSKMQLSTWYTIQAEVSDGITTTPAQNPVIFKTPAVTGMDYDMQSKFKVYPVPAGDNIYIDYDPYFRGTRTIISYEGKVIETKNIINEIKETIDISKYKSGIYLVKISNSTVTLKLIFIKF